MTTAVPGRWQRSLPDGRLQCTLCPRGCRLADGQRGFCFTRQRRGAELWLTSYHRPSGFCIDPIEKKPLFHFFPGSSVLSFGTEGCNLSCRFCQNWDLSRSRRAAEFGSVCTPEQIAETAQAWGCRSVAFTYNEPVVFAELAIDTARACHAHGISTVAVTAGYISDPARQEFFLEMDAANVDLKAFDAKFYRELCGVDIETVKETLVYLAKETRTWLELTTLLIPGKNDSDRELSELCEWVGTELGVEVPLHFTAFHPDFQLTDVPRTPPSTCRRARELALGKGLRFVYTGNVDDCIGQTSLCSNCGRVLVARDGYRLRSYRVDQDRCPDCATTLPGRFDPTGPGDFGPRRIPVTVPSRPSDG